MNARIGNYELIDRYAVGGVAEIYRARDLTTGELVVVKRIRPDIDFDPEQHAGFIRELQLALMCTHKNLIRGIHKGEHGGNDFAVLEYVDGQDLGHIIKRVKMLPLHLGVYVITEVLDGMDFAYRLKDATGKQLGLVHRDLAPKNVLIRYDGQVRVGDFGSSLATLTEPKADAIVGTLGYMSPEQARLEKLDQRSDVFAIGCILFELVCGQPAFDVEGKKDLAVLKAHQKGASRPVPAGVPEDLRLVIEIALAKEADDRYGTAREMKNGLMKTDYAPSTTSSAQLGALLRKIFEAEYRASRV